MKNTVCYKVGLIFFLSSLCLISGCTGDSTYSEPTTKETVVAQNTFTTAAKTTDFAQRVTVQKQTNLDLCDGLLTHKDSVSVPLMSKPPFSRAYKDPVFGARVIRISDTKNGEVVKPQYSTIQAWNADESRLMLYHTGGLSGDTGHHLYDGNTYQYLKKLDIVAKNIEEVYWHHTDPETLFYVSAYFKYYGEFIRYNIHSGMKTVIASFDKFCGKKGVPGSGNDVMMQPLDDDLFGFRCNDGAGHETGFSYRISTGEVRSLVLGEGSKYQQWYAPSPTTSGNYYRLNGDILESDLKTVRFKMDIDEFHSHSSLGRLANGHDALFTTAYDASPRGCDGGVDEGVGALVVHDIEDKTCKVIVSGFNGYGYPGSGTHVSAVAYNQPGWVLMTTIGYGQFALHTNNRPAPVLFSEVYLVNTDPKNQKLCRVAHHRSHGKKAENARYTGYFGEPHATLSSSGTRLVFGSDWYSSGSVDTYIVELPVHRK